MGSDHEFHKGVCGEKRPPSGQAVCALARANECKCHDCFCRAAQVFVFFPDDVKVGMKHIRTLAERMRSEGVQRAIMVAPVSAAAP